MQSRQCVAYQQGRLSSTVLIGMAGMSVEAAMMCSSLCSHIVAWLAAHRQLTLGWRGTKPKRVHTIQPQGNCRSRLVYVSHTLIPYPSTDDMLTLLVLYSNVTDGHPSISTDTPIYVCRQDALDLMGCLGVLQSLYDNQPCTIMTHVLQMCMHLDLRHACCMQTWALECYCLTAACTIDAAGLAKHQHASMSHDQRADDSASHSSSWL